MKGIPDYEWGDRQEDFEGPFTLGDPLPHKPQLYICDYAGRCTSVECQHKPPHKSNSHCHLRCVSGRKVKCIPYQEERDWIVVTEGGKVLEYELTKAQAARMLRNSDRRAFRWSQGLDFRWSEGVR